MNVVPPALPAIPLVDVGMAGPLKLLEAERARAEALIAVSRRSYTGAALRIGDAISRRWLERSANPYRRQIMAIGSALGMPGAALLNMSFEWTCTSGAAPSPDGSGNRMLRVLDWRLGGLGANVVIAREDAPAGVFYNVTWPGAVAVLTAMAPGRFSAAINQAPMRQFGLGLLGNWAANRAKVWQSTAIPPAHLLRQIFETARSYDEAKRIMVETPLCLPVLFTLSGMRAEEGCIIERTETEAIVHDGPCAVANAWRSSHLSGRVRGHDNPERRALMERIQRQKLSGFGWMVPPILNRFTRLAVQANAAQGTLSAVGYEQQAPATAAFHLH
jgi:hypothetical protein